MPARDWFVQNHLTASGPWKFCCDFFDPFFRSLWKICSGFCRSRLHFFPLRQFCFFLQFHAIVQRCRRLSSIWCCSLVRFPVWCTPSLWLHVGWNSVCCRRRHSSIFSMWCCQRFSLVWHTRFRLCCSIQQFFAVSSGICLIWRPYSFTTSFTPIWAISEGSPAGVCFTTNNFEVRFSTLPTIVVFLLTFCRAKKNSSSGTDI